MRCVVPAIGIALMIGAAGPSWALEPNDLVGTWKLLSNVRQTAGGDKVENNLGANPNGVMIITPDHRFTVIFVADGQKPAKTTEEFAALQKSLLAYSGLITLSPDPDNPTGLRMVTKVDVSWNAEWTGTSQTRFLSLEGNRLTIRTAPGRSAFTGEMVISTLVFERSR